MSSSDYIADLLDNFTRSGDIVSALTAILPQVVDELSCEAGSLFLHSASEAKLRCASCVGPVDIRGFELADSEGIVGRVFHSQSTEIVEDVNRDADHSKASDDKHSFVTTNILTTAVTFREERIGVLQLLNKKDGKPFSERHRKDAEFLASGIALGYHSAMLAKNYAETEVLRRDVKMASDVQGALKPLPDNSGKVCAEIIPYRNLSGDFFYFESVSHKKYFISADVSGKGVAASLTMSQAVTLFRYLAQENRPFVEIATLINDQVHKYSDIPRFITAFMGIYDAKNATLEYFNAGHGEVLFHQPSGLTIIDSMGPPLGVSQSGEVSIKPQVIESKDWRFMAVSDGISESLYKGKLFGLGGIKFLFSKTMNDSPQVAVEKIVKVISSGDFQLTDDASIMIMDA